MPSRLGITAYLTEEDFSLFKAARESYDLPESELLREIVHAWLFANRLVLKKAVR